MLLVAVQIVSAVKARYTAVEPAVCPLHRLRGIGAIGCAGTTLVERHHDIGTYQALDIHHRFRSEKEFAAIDMTAELHALVGHLSQVGQREHLKATGVCQYRMIPALELVQATGTEQNIRTGTQIQMVRIAQNDLRMNILFQFVAMNAFDRADSTYRHKNRRQYIAVVSMQHAGTCADGLGRGLQFKESHDSRCRYIEMSISRLEFVIHRKNDCGLERLCFLGRHERIRHDDHRVANVYEVRCRTVDADTSATALAGDNIGLDTCPVGVIHNLHTLTGIDVGCIHQILINRNAAHVLKVSLGNLYAMNLRFEYL